MHVADVSIVRIFVRLPRETAPNVRVTGRAFPNTPADGERDYPFATVPIAVQRIVLAHLVVETHDPDCPAAIRNIVRPIEPRICRRIKNLIAGNFHRIFVRAKIRRAPNPNLRNVFCANPLLQIQFLEDGGVADAIWFVRFLSSPEKNVRRNETRRASVAMHPRR